MFSYFGSKSKIVSLYEPPAYPLIIEPFAGSARYACRHLVRVDGKPHDVWLNDLNPVIYAMWEWIRLAKKEDIRSLPKLKKGDDLRKMDLPEAVRYLLGFTVGEGSAEPCHVVCGWAARDNETERLKARLLTLAERISHWKVTNSSYEDMPNRKATWFIDPPYQKMGDRYTFNNSKIDYEKLGEWCKSRKGQVIVCEGEGADWLPFSPIGKSSGRVRRKDRFREVVWYKRGKRLGTFI